MLPVEVHIVENLSMQAQLAGALGLLTVSIQENPQALMQPELEQYNINFLRSNFIPQDEIKKFLKNHTKVLTNFGQVVWCHLFTFDLDGGDL